jgi:tetratricopeptide (TPR) repeat protein
VGIPVVETYLLNYFQAGTCSGIPEKYSQALEYLNKATLFDPYNKYAWWNKGYVLEELNRYDDALNCYNKGFEINPTHGYREFRDGLTRSVSTIQILLLLNFKVVIVGGFAGMWASLSLLKLLPNLTDIRHPIFMSIICRGR